MSCPIISLLCSPSGRKGEIDSFIFPFLLSVFSDIRQDDPRPDESRTTDDLVRAAENAKLKSSDVNSPPFDLRSLSPLGIKWDESLLEVSLWSKER